MAVVLQVEPSIEECMTWVARIGALEVANLTAAHHLAAANLTVEANLKAALHLAAVNLTAAHLPVVVNLTAVDLPVVASPMAGHRLTVASLTVEQMTEEAVQAITVTDHLVMVWPSSVILV